MSRSPLGALVESPVVAVDPVAVLDRHVAAALGAEQVAHVHGQVAPALGRVGDLDAADLTARRRVLGVAVLGRGRRLSRAVRLLAIAGLVVWLLPLRLVSVLLDLGGLLLLTLLALGVPFYRYFERRGEGPGATPGGNSSVM